MPLGTIFNRILITTDGVDYNSKAVQTAIHLAQAYGAVLIALAVIDTRILADFHDQTEILLKKVEDELHQGCTNALEKIEELAKKDKVYVEKVIRRGKPYIEIVQESTKRNVSLIILGKRSQAVRSGRSLGGITERVMVDADCSVLIIR